MAKTPKWNGPQGSDDMEKDPLKRDTSGLGYPKPVDIERRVTPSADRDGGFSGKLDKGPKEDA